MSGILKAEPHSYGYWRAIVHTLAFVAALLAAGAGPASAKTLRLVVLGDSLTAGLGLPPGKAFPDQLQAALRAKGYDVDVVNAGVSGDTMEDGLARYDWSVPADANALIVELGANDMLRGLPPERDEDRADGHPEQGRGRPSADAARRHARRAQSGGGLRPGVRRDLSRRRQRRSARSSTRSSSTESRATPSSTSRTEMHPTAAGVAVIVERMLPSVEDLIRRAKP